jgi:hypothetical protein
VGVEKRGQNERNENGVLSRWTKQYPFDHQSQATLVPDITWRGDPKEYAW